MLTSENVKSIKELTAQLRTYRIVNMQKELLYRAKNRVNDLGISIPPALCDVQQSLNFARLAVRAPLERITLDSFKGGNSEPFKKVYKQNRLQSRSNLVHRDALLFGIGWTYVSHGNPELGEPEILITAESPMNVSVRHNPRTGQVVEAIIVRDEDKSGRAFSGEFLTATATIPFRLKDDIVTMREGAVRHNLGRVSLTPFVNEEEHGRIGGHSEITETIVSLTNSMMRTMLGAEVAREFYSSPQRYILGAKPEMFLDENGNPVSSLDVLMDRVQVISNNVQDVGDNKKQITTPTVGQFDANDPAPFIALMNKYAEMAAAEILTPVSYLGVNTVNPQSAEALQANAERLHRKCHRIIGVFEEQWEDVLDLVALHGGEEFNTDDVFAQFLNPEVLSIGAGVDALFKLKTMEAIRGDSEFVYDYLNIKETKREQIRMEMAAGAGRDVFAALAKLNEDPSLDPAAASAVPLAKPSVTVPVSLPDSNITIPSGV